ncbi:hypothetical protein ACFFX0_26350 [Citricoccus parietis]|uniref:Uncharacterized protein n=1 Tax=Citricoccus parietis TaxID=592307 RepID=A0ABV5G6F3_9MICC
MGFEAAQGLANRNEADPEFGGQGAQRESLPRHQPPREDHPADLHHKMVHGRQVAVRLGFSCHVLSFIVGDMCMGPGRHHHDAPAPRDGSSFAVLQTGFPEPHAGPR